LTSLTTSATGSQPCRTWSSCPRRPCTQTRAARGAGRADMSASPGPPASGGNGWRSSSRRVASSLPSRYTRRKPRKRAATPSLGTILRHTGAHRRLGHGPVALPAGRSDCSRLSPRSERDWSSGSSATASEEGGEGTTGRWRATAPSRAAASRALTEQAGDAVALPLAQQKGGHLAARIAPGWPRRPPFEKGAELGFCYRLSREVAQGDPPDRPVHVRGKGVPAGAEQSGTECTRIRWLG
jgi:hypothetical protein